jgi:excisionase family DNA binding protein
LLALQRLATEFFGSRGGVSVDEAAQFCGVSRDTIYAWIRDQRLIVMKIGKRTVVVLPSLLRVMVANITTSLSTIPPNTRRGERAAQRAIPGPDVTTAAEITRYVEENLLADTSPLSDRRGQGRKAAKKPRRRDR